MNNLKNFSNSAMLKTFILGHVFLTRWFAKRFLHPDIVAEYGYIFLWDEDLGVEHFHPDRYVQFIL